MGTEMSAGNILVVDDDRNLLELIQMRLESKNFKVFATAQEEQALETAREQIFDLSIIDLQLSNRDGISLMSDLHYMCPDMPVIILTAYGSIDSAVEAMKKGAYGYLTKPFDHHKLLFEVSKALENRRLNSEIKRLKEFVHEKYDFPNIVAKSEKMQEILMRVSLVARTNSTVYIHGESGTGKELIAKALHLGSTRQDKPFVAINCAALPETLLESELFGYEKGSFTGAVQSRAGLFMQADQGTLFLDEISSMSLALQAKMLRGLQEQQFYPVGSNKPVQVDVRFIVATNKDLHREVQEGRFREDLFYRIHVIPIDLPPLRERKEDIPLLVNHFLKQLGLKMGKEVTSITPEAMQKIMLHDWPGNIRELENTIEFAMAMTLQNVITEELILPSNAMSRSAGKPKSLTEAKAAFEKGYISNLLELTKGNISRAATLAGRYRADFYNILKKHNIKPDDYKT